MNEAVKLKQQFYRACAYARTLRDLPLSFAKNSIGMKCYTQAAIHIGLHIQGAGDVNVKGLHPYDNTVRGAIACAAIDHQKQLRQDITMASAFSGTAASDCLTQQVNSQKYNDFVIHFIEGYFGCDLKMRAHVLFLVPCNGLKNEENIENILSQGIYTTIAMDSDNFKKIFTLATDSANVVFTIVGVSAPQNVYIWVSSWMPCKWHKLNTDIKYLMKGLIAHKEDAHVV